jgi:glycosyltransferase involved in cell wall biosynthesis
MKKITVFTPTYNRAYCLHQVYESLFRQTSTDFEWLVIDDGSVDNTKELVNSWIQEGNIKIKYIYQGNLGMHGAHNTAYSNITTELNVCIDSDDFMPKTAIELILNKWQLVKNDKTLSGIVGLDANKDDVLIGTQFPKTLLKSTLYDIYNKHDVIGDKKLVYKTEITAKYPPYPIFSGERFVPLGYKYLLIDQDYKLATLNEVLCIVEYLADGSSTNMLKQYKSNPRGFAFSRINRMKYAKNWKDLFKNAIHYVSSSIMSGDKYFLKNSPKKVATLLAIPFGVILNFYINFKVKK